MRNENIKWDTGAHGVARAGPLSCSISHLSCTPYKLSWHSNASWEGCRGGKVGAPRKKADICQHFHYEQHSSMLRLHLKATEGCSPVSFISFISWFFSISTPAETGRAIGRRKQTELLSLHKCIMTWHELQFIAGYFLFFVHVHFVS